MAGVISRGTIPQFTGLQKGLVKSFGMAYADWKPFYPEMFEVLQSDQQFEEETLMSGLGLAQQKTEGGNFSYDSMAQGFTKRYQHTTYSNGFQITFEAIDDGKASVIGDMKTKAIKWSLIHTLELLSANVYNNAFDTAYTGGDSLNLCSTSHTITAGTLSNRASTDQDLSETSLTQAMVDIGNFTDDRGLRIYAQPRKLITKMDTPMFDANRLLHSVNRVSTTNNDINVIRNMGMFPEGTLANPYLTDADAWFILTDVKDGMKLFMRRNFEFKQENEFSTMGMNFVGFFRVGLGWTDYRAVYGSQGS